ncbi:hypothetical protein Bca4012_026573 [Brassica carinata]|uniref:Uncharacterized protein n=1 Tax=Brassica carinata TaxID=52824 RepID=A0A8X8AT97_BRACI|nr:hypothetical protein Bca52824_023597 [Brassica carinata]
MTLSCHCHVPEPYYEEREQADWEGRHTKPKPCLTTTDTDLHPHEPRVTGEPWERGLNRCKSPPTRSDQVKWITISPLLASQASSFTTREVVFTSRHPLFA